MHRSAWVGRPSSGYTLGAHDHLAAVLWLEIMPFQILPLRPPPKQTPCAGGVLLSRVDGSLGGPLSICERYIPLIERAAQVFVADLQALLYPINREQFGQVRDWICPQYLKRLVL